MADAHPVTTEGLCIVTYAGSPGASGSFETVRARDSIVSSPYFQCPVNNPSEGYGTLRMMWC